MASAQPHVDGIPSQSSPHVSLPYEIAFIAYLSHVEPRGGTVDAPFAPRRARSGRV